MKKLVVLAAGFGAMAAMAANLTVKVETDKPDCTYKCGEVAVFTVTAYDEAGAPATNGVLEAGIDNFGKRELSMMKVDLAKTNPFKISGSYDRPGFMMLKVKAAEKGLWVKGNNGGRQVWGVAVEPEKIRPGAARPADFDAFWADAVKKLEETTPADIRLEKDPVRSAGGVDYYRISAATWGGRRVWGWLSVPWKKGKHPVQVSVPGAGIGAQGTGRNPEAITLTMNVHSYPQPETEAERQAAYKKQDETYAAPRGVMRYCQAGIHESREDYFYYASLLGINRVVNWVWEREDVDRTRFTYSGTSQGGGFGLMLTGLNGHFTKSSIFVPAISDLAGEKCDGRQSGWPRILEAQRPENRAAAEKWAPYFDGAHFAARITCPVRVVAGYADVTCSPASVWAAYNSIPSKDKGIECGIGMGHGVRREYYDKLRAWSEGRGQ